VSVTRERIEQIADQREVKGHRDSARGNCAFDRAILFPELLVIYARFTRERFFTLACEASSQPAATMARKRLI